MTDKETSPEGQIEQPEQTDKNTRAWRTKVANARHARGFCVSCKNMAEPGKARCVACAAKANAAAKAWYARKHAKPTPAPAPEPVPPNEPAQAFPRQDGAEVVAEVIPTSPVEPLPTAQPEPPPPTPTQ